MSISEAHKFHTPVVLCLVDSFDEQDVFFPTLAFTLRVTLPGGLEEFSEVPAPRSGWKRSVIGDQSKRTRPRGIGEKPGLAAVRRCTAFSRRRHKTA